MKAMRWATAIIFCAIIVVWSVAAHAGYVDNGDWTVTDTSTGLIWEVKTDDGSIRDKDNRFTWQEVLAYCEALDLGGHTDWRLPTIKELRSLVDYTQYSPAINRDFFPNTVSSDYWSSTTDASYTGYAWSVGFHGGGDGSSGKGHGYYVRAVRGGQSGSLGYLIGQSPSSAPPGGFLTQWGMGFTPYSAAVLHFQKPDGTEFPTQAVGVNAGGRFEITYAVPVDRPAGQYKWWAIDGGTGGRSNVVTYEITSPGGGTATLEGYVCDKSSDAPISGATVSGPGFSTTSDGSGYYRILGLSSGDHTIAVEKSGYADLQQSVYLAAGATVRLDFRLQVASSGGIVVTDVTSRYDGDVYYLDGVDYDATYTVNVDWGSHTPQKVLFITPTATYEVATSGATASKTFNMGTEFGDCQGLKVKAVSSDGTVSAEMAAPLVVANRPFPVPLKGWDLGDGFYYELETGFNPDGIDDGVEAGDIPEEIPLFGNKAFKLQWLPRISAKVDSHGTCEASLESGKLTECKIMGQKIEFKTSLDAEAEYLRSSCAWDWEGYLTIKGKGEAKKSWPFLFMAGPVPIPMYTKASVEASVSASLGIVDLNPFKFNGILGISPYARGSLGAGVDSMLAVEGWIGGGADFGLQWPKEPTLADLTIYLNGGVSVYAVLWSWEHEALRWDWEYGGNADSAMFSLQNEPVTPRWTPRNYLDGADYGDFTASRALTRQAGAASLSSIQRSIFPYSESCLSAATGNVRLVWLYDDPIRTALNRTVLVSSDWNGANWNDYAAVDDDGTADFNSDLEAYEDGVSLVTWENEGQVMPDDAQFEDMLDHLEISVARFDGSGWTDISTLTQNDYLDRSPVLSGPASDDVLLVWISNLQNDIRGNAEAPNALRWSLWNGTSWSSPQQAGEIPYGIIKYDLAYDGTTGYAVLSLDADNDPQTVDDRELFSMTYSSGTWGALERLTTDSVPDENPKLAIDPSGDFVMAWLHGGDLVSEKNFDANAMTTILEGEYTSNLADFSLAHTPDGRMALVWAEPAEFSSDLFAVFYDPLFDVWGTPRQLTDDPETEQGMTAAFSAETTLMVVYDRTVVAVEQMSRQTAYGQTVAYEEPVPINTDLYMALYAMSGDLAVGAGSFLAAPGNPGPGTSVLLTVDVANAGDMSANNIPVAFYNGDPAVGGTEIGRVQTTETLAPGGSEQVQLTWTVPAVTASPLTLYVVVDPDNTFEDGDRNNNEASTVMTLADLSLVSVSKTRLSDTRFSVKGRVLNIGVLPSGTTHLVFRKNGADGEVLKSVDIPALAVNASVEGELTLENVNTATSIYLVVNADDETPEYNKENNSATLLLREAGEGVPTVTTASPTNITSATALGGGTVILEEGATEVTDRGLCWSTSSDPTISDSTVTCGSGTGSFSCNMTGLTQNTTYNVRAYASNGAGTGYGENRSFKTLTTVGCPEDCSGANPTVHDETFKKGTECTCTGTNSLIIGPNVVVESGARVTFTSDNIVVKSKVEAREGAYVKMGR